jgi:hypothetical protein
MGKLRVQDYSGPLPIPVDIHGRLLPSVASAHAAEKMMLMCFHCGTELKPWNPQIGTNPENRQQTPFKWCSNCCQTAFKRLCAYLGIAEEVSEEYLLSQIKQ